MTTPTHRDPQSLLIQTWRVIRGLWLAEVALVVAIWVAVPLILRGPREAVQDGGLLALIFYAVGLGDVALGWWMKHLALSPGRHAGARSREEIVGGVAGLSLVAVAMAVTPAVLGIAHFAMYVDRGVLSVMCVLSLTALALSWPNLDRWREILKSVSVTEQRSA